MTGIFAVNIRIVPTSTEIRSTQKREDRSTLHYMAITGVSPDMPGHIIGVMVQPSDEDARKLLADLGLADHTTLAESGIELVGEIIDSKSDEKRVMIKLSRVARLVGPDLVLFRQTMRFREAMLAFEAHYAAGDHAAAQAAIRGYASSIGLVLNPVGPVPADRLTDAPKDAPAAAAKPPIETKPQTAAPAQQAWDTGTAPAKTPPAATPQPAAPKTAAAAPAQNPPAAANKPTTPAPTAAPVRTPVNAGRAAPQAQPDQAKTAQPQTAQAKPDQGKQAQPAAAPSPLGGIIGRRVGFGAVARTETPPSPAKSDPAKKETAKQESAETTQAEAPAPGA